jgi:uncharacterized membrane protein
MFRLGWLHMKCSKFGNFRDIQLIPLSMRRISIYLMVLLLALPITINAQSAWELKVDEEGIQVYTRTLPDKKYLEVKATTTVKSSLHSLIALLKSVDQMGEWMKNFESNELLASENFWHQISYHEVYVPILQNRDVILDVKVIQNRTDQYVQIEMKSLPSYVPEKQKRTRIQEMHGTWWIKPMGNNELSVTYSMYVDPGKSIPAWLYNMRVKRDPFNTLKNVKEMVQKTSFAQAYYPELQTGDS